MLKEKSMQQPPTGYGHSPKWYGQQQPAPPSEQWAQQPYTPYPPQQGQWQQPLPPNPQWSQQQYWQTPPPPQTPKKKSNVAKYFVFGFSILIVIVFLLFILGAIAGNKGSTASSTLSEPDYKASTIDTTVEFLDKDGNTGKGVDVHFTATILSFVKDSGGNTAGANVDNGLTSGVIQVIFPAGTDLSQINTGDTLEVWGFDDGTFSGSNAFGATIQEVAIEAFYMTDQTTSYQTA